MKHLRHYARKLPHLMLNIQSFEKYSYGRMNLSVTKVDNTTKRRVIQEIKFIYHSPELNSINDY